MSPLMRRSFAILHNYKIVLNHHCRRPHFHDKKRAVVVNNSFRFSTFVVTHNRRKKKNRKERDDVPKKRESNTLVTNTYCRRAREKRGKNKHILFVC